jgi:hypothetical protein
MQMVVLSTNDLTRNRPNDIAVCEHTMIVIEYIFFSG